MKVTLDHIRKAAALAVDGVSNPPREGFVMLEWFRQECGLLAKRPEAAAALEAALEQVLKEDADG